MKNIFKTPEKIDDIIFPKRTIFLAGSIEMDRAINWQKICEAELSAAYILFNPRRDEWNAEWVQSIKNPIFKEQVLWELNALERADIIVMFFAAGTQSPISLLELGLFAQTKKLKVVVEEDFWRKGNIDVVCEKYEIEQFKSLQDIIHHLKLKS